MLQQLWCRVRNEDKPGHPRATIYSDPELAAAHPNCSKDLADTNAFHYLNLAIVTGPRLTVHHSGEPSVLSGLHSVRREHQRTSREGDLTPAADTEGTHRHLTRHLTFIDGHDVFAFLRTLGHSQSTLVQVT